MCMQVDAEQRAAVNAKEGLKKQEGRNEEIQKRGNAKQKVRKTGKQEIE